MRKTEIELMIDELQALLKYEEVLENKRHSKSKVSYGRLVKTEEWNKVSKAYWQMKEEILHKIRELRKLLMKKIEVFEEYYVKNPY